MRFGGREDELEGRRGVKTHQRDEISSMGPLPAPEEGWLAIWGLGFTILECQFRVNDLGMSSR